MNGEKKMSKSNERAVLVTTAHRGVFFGYLVGEPSKERLMLLRARNVIYWTTDTRGFLGLAASGPGAGCRVSRAVPELTVWDVTSVVTCTPEAIERMELGPWQ
jgi:hypothetical protein